MVARYRDLLRFVQTALPSMRVTRQRNLAATVMGIFQVRGSHLTLSEIAGSVPGHSDHWHKFKRIWRFVSNVKWAPGGLFDELLSFFLTRYRPGPFLPIIIDQSSIAGKWEVLWASMPFRGRALPIRFRVFRYSDIHSGQERSQNAIEEQSIREVVRMVPCPLCRRQDRIDPVAPK